MQKESRISLLPAIVAVLASLSSAYMTGRVMLVQQAMVMQESREKLAGDNAYKDLQKIRQLSYELNALAEQFEGAMESRYNHYQLNNIAEKIRDKGNELYFQAGDPFGGSAMGIVYASKEYVTATTRDEAEKEKLLKNFKASKQRFFTGYLNEMAEYQKIALPGKMPNDIATRFIKRFLDRNQQVSN